MSYPRRRPNYDDELVSKTLHVDQKRFYIDLKENSYGQFVKIIESNSNRGTGKHRVIIPQEMFRDFLAVLAEYVELNRTTGNGSGSSESSERIQSEVITNDRKTLYVDLRRNSRGKFLKVTEQNGREDDERPQVIVPSEGLEVLCDVIADILGIQPDRRDRGDPRDRREGRERREPRDREVRERREPRGERRDQRDQPRNPHEPRPPREPRREPREGRKKEQRQEAESGPASEGAEQTNSSETDPKSKPAGAGPIPNGEVAEETDEVDPDLPPSVEVISERKRFYFDVKRNDMGVFLQISEVADSLDSHVVTRRRRRHINIPHLSWGSCQKAFEKVLEDLPYEPPPDPPEEPEVLVENGEVSDPPDKQETEPEPPAAVTAPET